jgi:hypothetical protein
MNFCLLKVENRGKGFVLETGVPQGDQLATTRKKPSGPGTGRRKYAVAEI